MESQDGEKAHKIQPVIMSVTWGFLISIGKGEYSGPCKKSSRYADLGIVM